ncbi:hypothetical protein ID866_11488 [Astraeus odoratus]|nr:hypothetical protein ID866_11488 [Astraeus odoratus]
MAAWALSPPCHTLTFEEVVEYAFLSDFKLLKDACEDISDKPWASPTARSALDMYFKSCCAQEEITQLNIEVRRFVTYLQDEDRYLHDCEMVLLSSSPALAYQVRILHNIHRRFNELHVNCLLDIARLPGFSGMLIPSKSTKDELGSPAGLISVTVPAFTTVYMSLEIPLGEDTPDDLGEEQEEEETSEECVCMLEDVLQVTSVA